MYQQSSRLNRCYKRYYLYEYQMFDGECFVTFNVVEVNPYNDTITVAVTKEGSICVSEYTLFNDNNRLYFEYRDMEIDLDDFECSKED